MYDLVVGLLQPFPLLCLVTAVALAGLWRKHVPSRRRLLLLTIPLLLLALVSTPAVAYLAIGSLEWQYPPLTDRPKDAEAIVVLGGHMWLPDNVRADAELGESTLYRCLHVVQLYQRGEPCPVVVSGGKVHPGKSMPTLAEVMRDFLAHQGVAPVDLLIEDQSRSTYENAVNTRQLLRQRGIDRIVLVTDATHLLRAEACFRAQGVQVVPSGCRYRATCFEWSLRGFLPSPNAAKDTQRALHEWLGLAWYRLRGRV